MDGLERDSKAGYVGLLPVDSLNSNHNDYAPSADDLAWVDSCLTDFNEASDTDWSSFKESLSEILNAPTEPVTLLAADGESKDHIELGDDQTFPSSKSMSTAFSMLNNDHSDSSDEDESMQDGEDDSVDDVINRKRKGRLKRKLVLEENALLSDHTDFAKVESSALGTSPVSSEFKVETSSDEIFKVWDLDASDEQDEFTKELNEALEESRVVASTSAVTEGWQDLTIEPLDDLIAGISDLSLGQSAN